jgi:TDG/mug DNA glycosylase family protein
VGAYRVAFNRPKANVGPQEEHIGGSKVWVLPNPSGLNAHYQVEALADLYRAAALAAGLDVAPGPGRAARAPA